MLKRKKHFMNSTLSIPCIFSCALDSFLEIASCLFLPHLSDLTVRNEFTELLFNTCSRYVESPENSRLLEEISCSGNCLEHFLPAAYVCVCAGFGRSLRVLSDHVYD